MLSSAGVEPVKFDGMSVSAELKASIASTSHLLISIAPQVADDDAPLSDRSDSDRAGSDALLNLLAQYIEQSSIKWIGYLSTVGVYGDHQGAWVDETTQCNPKSERSVRRLDAELAWSAFAFELKISCAIFRLAGIYGPGRNAFCNLKAGTARRIIKPDQVFNRIHVDDIARVVAVAANHRADGIYNVCDDHPSSPESVIEYASELMGVDLPVARDFDQAELSPMARSFYSENKRVSNERSKSLPGLTYRYSDYRAGLDTLWHCESWPDIGYFTASDTP